VLIKESHEFLPGTACSGEVCGEVCMYVGEGVDCLSSSVLFERCLCCLLRRLQKQTLKPLARVANTQTRPCTFVFMATCH